VKSRLRKVLIDLSVFTIGILSLLSPFILQQTRNPDFAYTSFPLMVSLIIVLCLILLLFEIQSSFLDNKMIAFLGVLIAINAGLRFLENAIPGPAGFSPTFFLIILTGYFFGSRIGFLMGAMTMFVSGLITGGIGPWLPGQMITAGWLGQSSSFLKPLINILKWQQKSGEIILLSIFSALWGILYGVIMNLWFWPFFSTAPGQTWLQSAGLVENIGRYGTYYLATSFGWDITRSIGNIFIIVFLSKPVIRIFIRFQKRFSFVIGEAQQQ